LISFRIGFLQEGQLLFSKVFEGISLFKGYVLKKKAEKKPPQQKKEEHAQNKKGGHYPPS
jgi:hypothetical protein